MATIDYTDNTGVAAQLYLAYLGRPADSISLNWWAQNLPANGSVNAATTAAFFNSTEGQALFGNMTTSQVINQAFENLFGRAATSDDLKLWGQYAQKQGFTNADLPWQIFKAGQSSTKDQANLNTRLAAANAYTESADASAAQVLGLQTVAGATAARAWLAPVTSTSDLPALNSSIPASLATVANSATPGQTSALTTGVDNLTGSTGNDTFVSNYDTTAANGKGAPTLTALDVLNGGAGTDTLQITYDDGATPAGKFTMPAATLNSIENVTIRAAGDVVADVSGANVTGLNNISVLQSVGAKVIAAATTGVSVTGATDTIVVDGGSTVNVTAATKGQVVTIGESTKGAAGAVTLTHSNLDTSSIAVNGGTDVTVTASKVAGTGTIKVGDTTATGVAADMPSGKVTINAASAATNGDAALSMDAITVVGGSSVTVTQSVTAGADVATKSDVTNAATQGDVTVTGSAATTSVTVNQSAAAAGTTASTLTAGSKEVQVVTFTSGLAKGASLTINGLTFTAAADLKVAQVAAAFANLTNGGTTSAGGTTANGIYTNANSTLTMTSGAATASGANYTVTFTGTANTNLAGLTINQTAGTAPTVTATTDGAADTGTAATGALNVVDGKVTINGQITGTDVLATANLDAYGSGSTVKSDALTTLNLANSAKDLVVTNAAATTLNLGLNNVTTGSTVDLDNATKNQTYTTLNITTSGKDSAVDLTAAKVQALTVSGTNSVDLSTNNSTLSALKTVTVTGSAGLTIDASGTNVISVDTTGTTGAVTAKLDASKATYTGGAGVDTVTLTSTTVGKAISLGAGDDTLNLATGTNALGALLDGGTGTNTLGMAAADAALVSQGTTFQTNFTNFQKLSLAQVAAGASNSVDLSHMNGINYVISNGGAAATPEKQTFTVTAATGAGTAVVDGTNVIISGSLTQDAVGAAIVAQKGAIIAADSHVADVSYAGGVVTLTFTTAAGNVSAITTNADSAHTGITFGATADNAQAFVAGGTLALTKMANNGTLELTGSAGTTAVTMADSTGSSDTFNVVTKVSTANIDFGTVAVAGVETVNITATDTQPTDALTGLATIDKATLLVSDAAAKSVVITGNSDLALTTTSKVLTSVDASHLTGALTLTTNGTVAETITGGSGNDVLASSLSGDVLIGGAGNDTLKVGADLVTLTGGAGNDTFDVSYKVSNSSAYATITDLGSGDKLLFSTGAANFKSAKVTLGDTAVFQDLANKAIATSAKGDVSWFQYGGNTYAIEHNQAGGTAFQNGTDAIVKITGQVDLSADAFNATAHALTIA